MSSSNLSASTEHAPLACLECGLPFARMQEGVLIITSRHHGQRHLNTLSMRQLCDMLDDEAGLALLELLLLRWHRQDKVLSAAEARVLELLWKLTARPVAIERQLSETPAELLNHETVL